MAISSILRLSHKFLCAVRSEPQVIMVKVSKQLYYEYIESADMLKNETVSGFKLLIGILLNRGMWLLYVPLLPF